MSTENQKKSCKTSCDISRMALLLGDVWTILIIDKLLLHTEQRFGDLATSLSGISNSVLSNRLKILVEADLISRQSISSMPPQVIYSLTSKGVLLTPVIQAMYSCGAELGKV